MSRPSAFLTSITTLWLRLATLGVVALVFTEALLLAPGKAQGWSYYLTTAELWFEVLVRLIAAALAGLAVGTICSALLSPLLRFQPRWRERLIDSSTKVVVVIAVFLVSRYALEIMIKWSYSVATHPALYDKLLLTAQFVVFAVALCIPRSRRAIVTSLDGFLDPNMTRRTVVTTLVATAGVVATEFVLGKTLPQAIAAAPSQQSHSNFLLITFDALSAEDMSLYGRRVPTTPNIDAFARQATVFTNYYSTSTFTTPTVTTIMTGTYPSDNLIYQLQGKIRNRDAEASLPAVLRKAGYRTAAFLSNPFAYYVVQSMAAQYNDFSEPVFQKGGLASLWKITGPLHQNSGFGCRIDEYFDLELIWNYWGRMPNNLSMRYRPDASFEQANKLLQVMPDGFFLWLHLITPHNPYLPDHQERGRFLPDSELTTFEEEFGNRWKPHYPPDQQKYVDQRRLRYDEFIATADRCFGNFMSQLQSSGRLSNTTVVVSADHGESFEGGVYEHSSPYLTRPVIHIPMIVRTPGQRDGSTVKVTADQTSLAPTILEMAGVAKPESMKGPSLVPWLGKDGGGAGEGMAYCQYFERNSIFKPLRHGSVGVIDGHYQYVEYLDKQKGVLRPLSEAQEWTLDRSSEYPEQAAKLRHSIYSRFPELTRS